MPELPEVETIVRGLTPLIVGRTVCAVHIHQARLRALVPPTLPGVAMGQQILGVRRRSKYLWLEFTRGGILVHLGMSGSLRLTPGTAPLLKHDHVEIVLDNNTQLRYHDPRRFGLILWAEDSFETHPLLQDLGVEPLSDDFNALRFYHATRTRRGAIKPLLMNARLVVGVGNIYASEALFLAGIDPRCAAINLTRARCARLVDAVKRVLEEALQAGGTTLRDYRDGQGRPGYFQRQLRVYGRAQKPCRVCGTAIRALCQGQRTTFYCPRCQR